MHFKNPLSLPLSLSNLGGLGLAPKRQRRPTVRLGEIGDQPATLSYEAHLRRNNKLWRLPKDTSKSSKTRPLTNLVTNGDFHETLVSDGRNFSGGDDGNTTIHDFANRRTKEPKAKKASVKRVRSNWVSSKTDDFCMETPLSLSLSLSLSKPPGVRPSVYIS